MSNYYKRSVLKDNIEGIVINPKIVMSIRDVILFISSTSQVCMPPIEYIRQNQLPVKIVRLDTVIDRQAASQGKYFQINSVPTLLLIYDDGNIQLFAGQEKILMWLQQALQSRNQSSSPAQHTSVEEERPREHSRTKTSKTKKHPSKREKSGSKSKTQKSDGLYEGSSKVKSSKKKKPPVQFVDEESGSEDEVPIEFIDDGKRPNRPPPPPTQGLLVGPQSFGKKKSQMSSVYDVAKQMEQARQSTLGYDEADLPVPT